MLPDSTLTRLLAGGESDCVEFTESTKDLDKIRRAVCAFANDLPGHGDPGVLFVGMRDDGSCSGSKIDDALLRTLGGLRNDGKILPFPVMEINKRTLNGCEVAVIQVEPSDNPPVKVDGRCWIRVGPTRAQASAEEERRLTEKRRWGNVPYDMQGVPAATVEKDIDRRKFRNEYLPAAVSPEVLEENERSPEDQMLALRLTTADGTPTVTAILIAGKDPYYWFPCAYVQFARFEGKELTDPIKDQKEIRGTLPEQLRELDLVLRAHITIAMDTSGETHKESADYPFDALRELSRNAIIHRSYENSNTPVRVYWFSDRVEISNPGTPYGAVTRLNFGESGLTGYRNPTIAEAMKYLGFMQRFGLGILTARKALERNGNPPLEFDLPENFVIVTIRKNDASFYSSNRICGRENDG